ncbi:hypothetical protein LX36DRAFT_590685, partial [Colletotrichum falcatum]
VSAANCNNKPSEMWQCLTPGDANSEFTGSCCPSSGFQEDGACCTSDWQAFKTCCTANPGYWVSSG